MKTTIIQLEAHDDIVSARDKMGWAKGGRILLVWPERGELLNRRLDLALLQRHSLSLGAQLALVSHDPEVRYHAPRLGIPVFKSLRKAEKDPWRVARQFRSVAPLSSMAATGPSSRAPASGIDDPGAAAAPPSAMAATAEPAERKLPERPDIAEPVLTPLQRLIFFGLGVLAVLAIAAVLTPSATIVLTPQTQVQDVVLDVSTGPGVTQTELSGAAPSHWVYVTVEGRDVEPAGGTMHIAERTAGGDLEFTNLTDQSVDVPVGTIARTAGGELVRFGVTREGVLPPGPGTTLTLPAQALDPGESGNLPTESLTALEGRLGTQISVNNPRATTGGASRVTPAPSAGDRRKLHERLSQALAANALEELKNQIAPGDLVIEASLHPVETIEETFNPGEGLPADRLTLNLRLEYAARVVAVEDLQRLAGAVFDANLPAGFIVVPDSLQVENLTQPAAVDAGGEVDDPVYRWSVHAYRRIMARIDSNQVTRLVLGRSAKSGLARLGTALPLEAAPELRMQPAWWPRLPVLPFRVNVVTSPEG